MGERKAQFESGTLIGVSMSEPHLVLRMPLLSVYLFIYLFIYLYMCMERPSFHKLH